MSSSIEPSVHYLDFKDGKPAYDRFHVLWKLVDLDKQPTVLGDNVDGSKQNDFRLAEGDLVVFPTLLSGAGEFEGLRFVGLKMTDDDDALPLLPAGIEYPEFPSLIVQHIDNVASLKSIYEAPFNAVLEEQEKQARTLGGVCDQNSLALASYYYSKSASRKAHEIALLHSR